MCRSYVFLMLLIFGLLPLLGLATVPHLPPQHIGATTVEDLLAADWDNVDTIARKGENTRLISSGLAILLGPFGAHRLYLGTTTRVAVVYGLTFGGFGVLALLDLGHLLFTKDLAPYRNNDQVFMWGKGEAPTPP